MTSPICLAFSLYSSEDGSTIVGSIDMALAWLGVQCVATPREDGLAGREIVRRFDLGMRRESFKAPREALKVDIVFV